jgi:hypothetical protein
MSLFPWELRRMAWSETFLKVLKDNDVRLVNYVQTSLARCRRRATRR